MGTGEAIALYLRSQEGVFAARTMRQYRGTLKRLPDVPLAEHTDETLTAWRNGLVDRHGQPLSNDSKNKNFDRVRAFLTYAHKKEWLARNPADLVPPLKKDSHRQVRINAAQLCRLLDSTDKPWERAVLAVAREWLLRASEIQQLRVGQIHLDTGMADVQVMKKEGVWAWDELPITEELRPELEAWLAHYRRMIGRPLPHNAYLFPSVTHYLDGKTSKYLAWPNQPMSHPYLIVRRALTAIGVLAGRRGMHVIRRSMARLRYDDLIEGDGKTDDALAVVSALLHHDSVRTTELYLGVDGARTRRNKIMQSSAWRPITPTATVDETAGPTLAKVIRLTP